MRIGFDLDGVLLKQDIAVVVLTVGNKAAEKIYYESLIPQLNPYIYMNQFDEAVIITARAAHLEELTKKQCTKFFPAIPFYILNGPLWTDTSEWLSWLKEIARRKALKIRDLELDVYFEDDPNVVLWLRDMCPNTVIIQYGGRIQS